MILISGASGNVGKEVLRQMTQTGVEVRAAFQSVSKAAGTASGVEIVLLDYNRPETLRNSAEGCGSSIPGWAANRATYLT